MVIIAWILVYVCNKFFIRFRWIKRVYCKIKFCCFQASYNRKFSEYKVLIFVNINQTYIIPHYVGC